MAVDLQKTAESFRRNRYEVSLFSTADEAKAYLCREIRGVTVGLGDSLTLLSMELFEALSEHNQVTDPQHIQPGEDFVSTAKGCALTDVFLTSVNGATEDGLLINIDGTGNRVAGSLFGHKKVYFVLGRNKVAPTLEEAMWRARNIAAPLNAKRLNLKTPCAVTGRCHNCDSFDRICNAITVHHKRMRNIEMEIVLIDEDMGY